MKRASITYTKNNFSRLLGMVREGDTLLVTDRKQPVARIEPVSPSRLDRREGWQALIANGIALAPKRPLDAKRFLKCARAIPRRGASASAALLRDREEQP